MGILDDAIREHLDLKRRTGAEEDELKRLEGEAFGPPTRPGDPDFPEEQAPAAAVTEAPAADAPTSEEPLAEPPATAEEPIAPPADESAPSGFFDQSADELALDVDMSLDDEAARVAETGEQAAAPPPPEPEPPPPPPPETGEAPVASEAPATDEREAVEPPIESLDTVEHPFEEAVEDTGEAELVEGEIAEEGDQPEKGEEEDVLEETPEFLRDAPEDDELWFEQGEPKDFDF
jgi:hypothetical protein